MLNHRTLLGIVATGFLLATAACGGSDKPEPKAPEKTAEAPADDQPQKGSEDAKAEGGATKKSEPASEDTGPKFTRTAKDILTAPDVVFVLSFANSEVGEKAEASCSKAAKDNPKKQNQCMAKARKKVTADVLSFSKDKKEKWWWITARMKGAKLTALHKVEFEFGEEKPDSIVIKPSGKDRGTKPWAQVPGQITIGVPNEFSIVLTDPTYGKMTYEAKIGIAGGDDAAK